MNMHVARTSSRTTRPPWLQHHVGQSVELTGRVLRPVMTLPSSAGPLAFRRHECKSRVKPPHSHLRLGVNARPGQVNSPAVGVPDVVESESQFHEPQNFLRIFRQRCLTRPQRITTIVSSFDSRHGRHILFFTSCSKTHGSGRRGRGHV